MPSHATPVRLAALCPQQWQTTVICCAACVRSTIAVAIAIERVYMVPASGSRPPAAGLLRIAKASRLRRLPRTRVPQVLARGRER